MNRRKTTICDVRDCGNDALSMPHLRFYSVPREEERRKKWLQLIGREEMEGDSQVSNMFVCSIHFSVKRARLPQDVVPSLYLPIKRDAIRPDEDIPNETPDMDDNVVVLVEIDGNEAEDFSMELVSMQEQEHVVDPEGSDQQMVTPLFVNITEDFISHPETESQSIQTQDKNEVVTKDPSPAENAKTTLRMKCPECWYMVKGEEKLVHHIRRAHRGENPFQCTMCEYSTYNTARFNEHVWAHKGIKPFKCPHCDYRSVSKKYLKKHRERHTANYIPVARKPQSLKPQSLKPQSLKPQSLKPQTLKPETLKAHILERRNDEFVSCKMCNYEFESHAMYMDHTKNMRECRQCEVTLCPTIYDQHICKTIQTKSQQTKRVKQPKSPRFTCTECLWESNGLLKILLHLIHHPNQDVDESKIQHVDVLRQCGINVGAKQVVNK